MKKRRINNLVFTIVVVGIVIIACILCNKLSNKIGIPMLLAFILLGMVFGSDGIFKIEFENFEFAEQFCSIALIFIIFYGGFGTNWHEAKKVALPSLLLSSAGVLLTALLTGIFCRYVLGFGFYEGLLIGAVLSSTDAASVFSLLRSKKLNLKYGTASMLELESGSNDPWAYMLTVILLTLMGSGSSKNMILHIIFSQVFYGMAAGAVIAVISLWALTYIKFEEEGFDTIFVVAVALLSYAIPSLLGGNGYLSAYIVGIVLGNKKIANKKALVHFFDGITGLMQMFIFFLLGLLAFPSQIPNIIIPALIIFVFLSFVARPAAVMAVLIPFKAKPSQQMMVSWAGLRGATSIVFAIMVKVSDAYTNNDVFHIAFCVVLLSIGIQGTLLPLISKRLNMIDDNENVMRTFNDYSRESKVQFLCIKLIEKHLWIGEKIKDIALPPNVRIAVILRDNIKIIPKGNTSLETGDNIILSTVSDVDDRAVEMYEVEIDSEHEWCNKKLLELKLPNSVIVFIKRAENVIIPSGDIQIESNDVLVVLDD